MESITERRGPQGDRRPHRSKTGWLIQAVVAGIVSLLVGFIVAFYTATAQAEANRAATELQIRTGLAVIEERQRNQNEEVMRAIQSLREDLREVGRVRR
jgi:hypothetical protein